VQKPARSGQAIQLTAIPNSGATFVGWKGVGQSFTSGFSVCNVNPRYLSDVVAVFSNENNLTKTQKMEDSSKLSENQKIFDAYSCIGEVDSLIYTDSKNGLMWKTMSESNAVSYEDALKVPEFSGFSDWRLPTKEEFLLMLKNPGITGVAKGFYWTSSKISSNDLLNGYCEIVNEDGWSGVCDPQKFGNRLVRYVRTIKKDFSEHLPEIFSDLKTSQHAELSKSMLRDENFDKLSGGQQIFVETISTGDVGNLILIDSESGLMWKAMSELDAISYDEALKAPEFLGFSDWRLPTKEEFLLMLKNQVITGMSEGFYWTSSKRKATDMFDGYREIVNERGLVRLCDPRGFGNRLVRYVRSQLSVVNKPDTPLVKGKPQGENLTDNNDVTISDYNTGLMWAKFRDDRAKNVQEALVLTSDLAGFVDWRLPSSAELRTISPIDERFFPPPTRGYYFSSTRKKSDVSSLFDICELVTSAGMTDSIYANAPKEAYVRFVRYEDAYPINFTAFGTGSGVVTKKLLNGVKSSNPEVDGYAKNSLIEISAIPNKGSVFKEWRGDIRSQDDTQSILMDSQKSITVEFELQSY